MSWVSKTVKKAARSVKKHVGSHWWVPGYGLAKGMGQMYKGIYDEYKDKEGMYNRLALMIGASVAGGAALGGIAGSLSGAGFGTGAASGAVTGVGSGAISGGAGAYEEYQANKLQEKQKEIAEEERKQIALANLKEKGNTPAEMSSLDFNAPKKYASQLKKNLIAAKNKKLGGQTSTLA